MRALLLCLSICLVLISCNKDQDNNIIYGYQYFPADSGTYVVYDVIDILHDDVAGVHDTDYYQIMEVVGEEDIDLEGETFNKLYRYERASDTLSWGLKDVWTFKKSSRSVEVVEENQRVIKLAFSISYDQYWDCNALNNFDAQQCYYSDIYEPKTVNSLAFDSTVVVEREDFSSFIEYNRAYDIYAANVGLVKSVSKDLEIDNGDTLQVLKGTELYYTVVSYGN